MIELIKTLFISLLYAKKNSNISGTRISNLLASRAGARERSKKTFVTKRRKEKLGELNERKKTVRIALDIFYIHLFLFIFFSLKSRKFLMHVGYSHAHTHKYVLIFTTTKFCNFSTFPYQNANIHSTCDNEDVNKQFSANIHYAFISFLSLLISIKIP